VRALAIARRIAWQLLRDKRTLAMIFVAPIAVLGLLSLIFNGDEYHPRIAVVGGPPPAVALLAGSGARPTALDADRAHRRLRDGQLDAVLELTGTRPHLTVEGSDPSVTRSVMLVMYRLARATGRSGEEPQVSYLHGSAGMSAFDNFGPVLLGFLVFFFTFMVSGISFVRERTTGTLERMLATPVRRWEVVIGYLIGFAGVVIVQAGLTALFAVYALDMMLVGSFASLAVIVLLVAASALTLGMLLSAWARSEFQVIQFIPIAVLPQVFFSGLFSLETMHPALRALGRVLPLTYAADAMRAVMIRGDGVAAIAVDLAVLAGFSAVCLAANVVALRAVRRL